MPDIFAYVQAGTLRDIIRQYSTSFNIPVLILDPNRDVLLKQPENTTWKKLNAQPLKLRDLHLGYIAVPSARKSAQEALAFMEQNLVEMLKMGYDIDSLSAEVARNYEEISLLWQLTSKLGLGLDVDRICSVLADEVMKICPSNNVTILLSGEMPAGDSKDSCLMPTAEKSPLQPPKTFLFPKISLGEDANSASMMALDADRGIMAELLKRKEPITICDVREDKRIEGFTYPVTRLLAVPLMVEGEVIGAILATDKLDGDEFYSTEIKLVSSIATECAVSIKKALLYDEIHDMLFSTAEAFSLAMDAKDPYTYGHSKRVSELSASIAKSFGLSVEEISKIRLAALLHDIGKIGTPEVILGKDSDLEPEEMDRMREHPYAGARMIESIRRMKEIARWMCHHHEKYDGTGYPSRLKGDVIPLPSRIIALADYYDALTSDRPYRKALSRDDAIKTMKESVGTHFDPLVFEHFVKVAAH